MNGKEWAGFVSELVTPHLRLQPLLLCVFPGIEGHLHDLWLVHIRRCRLAAQLPLPVSVLHKLHAMASLTTAMSRLSVGTVQQRPAARTVRLGAPRPASISTAAPASFDGLAASNRLGLNSADGAPPC